MSKEEYKLLKVTATPSEGVEFYELKVRIDKHTIRTLNRSGITAVIGLKSPGKYTLLWYYIGNPKETLELEVEVDGKPVFEKIRSRIPAEESGGAGAAPFEIGKKA